MFHYHVSFIFPWKCRSCSIISHSLKQIGTDIILIELINDSLNFSEMDITFQCSPLPGCRSLHPVTRGDLVVLRSRTVIMQHGSFTMVYPQSWTGFHALCNMFYFSFLWLYLQAAEVHSFRSLSHTVTSRASVISFLERCCSKIHLHNQQFTKNELTVFK